MSAAQTATKGAFMDRRVFLVGPSDDRLAIVSDAPCRHEQADDGPTFLVVSDTATDDDLARVRNRFSEFTINQLRAFRDAQRRETA